MQIPLFATLFHILPGLDGITGKAGNFTGFLERYYNYFGIKAFPLVVFLV